MATNQTTDSAIETKLRLPLLALRVGIATVFAMWTIDKFVNPGHAAAVFAKFYGIKSLGLTMAYAVGALQSVLIIAFLCGAFRSFSYTAILIMHAISTFSSYKQYLDPWTYPHLLFFAAIPMLAACYALWSLRKYDTLLAFDARKGRSVEVG